MTDETPKKELSEIEKIALQTARKQTHKRGRKALGRLESVCKECKKPVVLIVQKNGLAAYGKCSPNKGRYYRERVHHNVQILTDDVEKVLYHYLMSLELTEEDPSNIENRILAVCFEEWVKKVGNGITIERGYSSRRKAFNWHVHFPNKYFASIPFEIIEDYTNNNRKYINEIQEIDDRYGEISQEKDMWVEKFSEMKKVITEIKEFVSMDRINVDDELIQMNERMAEINRSWYENEMKKMVETEEKRVEDMKKELRKQKGGN